MNKLHNGIFSSYNHFYEIIIKIKKKKKKKKKKNKIKYLTIAYVQDFEQNFTLIALLRVIHITVI